MDFKSRGSLMANIQFFNPISFHGPLTPGQSSVISTPILLPVPRDNENLVFVVTARPVRTGPHVFAAGIRDVNVVNNDAPGGLNLNIVLVNAHATETLTDAVISIAAIS
jgi:hypothetical protein